MRDDCVRNNLFVGGIIFRLSPRQKEIVSAQKQCPEVFLRFKIQAMKTAELIEETAPDDQNIFVRLAHARGRAA
jgi:hypothetical protein